MKSYNGTLFRPVWTCLLPTTDTDKERKEQLQQKLETRYGFYLTISQVMEVLPIGRSSIYHAVSTGQLNSTHIGRRIIISVSDLVEYIYPAK